MAESFEDQVSRVEQMASGSPTWDLSPNDIAALKAVLGEMTRLRELVSRAVGGLRILGEFESRAFKEPHSLDCSLAGRVSKVFCTGMTRATALCREFKHDPAWMERYCACGEPCDVTGFCDDCMGG